MPNINLKKLLVLIFTQITCKKIICFIFLFIVVLFDVLLTLDITGKSNFIRIRQYIGWILYCIFGPKKLAILVNTYNQEKSLCLCLQQSCFLYKLSEKTAAVNPGYQINGVVSVNAEDSEGTGDFRNISAICLVW